MCTQISLSFFFVRTGSPSVHHLLVLPYALADLPEAIGHDKTNTKKVDGGAESTSGKVSFVLDGVVAARRRHVLRHDGRIVRVRQLVFLEHGESIGEVGIRLRIACT